MTKVALIIACWGGHRRVKDTYYEADRAAYLKLQLDYLSKLDHSLSAIVFANNLAECQSKRYKGYLSFYNDIPTEINGCPVKKIQQPNRGMSYGLFSLACETYKDEFDYYIFMEDDVVLIRDNFDRDLVSQHKRMGQPGFLCAYMDPMDGHAAVSFGIADYTGIAKVFDYMGRLPFEIRESLAQNYGANESQGQVGLGHGFRNSGCRVYDFIHFFNVPFYDSQRNLFFVKGRNKDKPTIFMPSQVMHERDFKDAKVLSLSTQERDSFIKN